MIEKNIDKVLWYKKQVNSFLKNSYVFYKKDKLLLRLTLWFENLKNCKSPCIY